MANGLYGVLGMYSCMYYNIHVAATTTTQGRSLVSSAGLCFESFLANSVKFGSLDEVITFIDNVITEDREFDDYAILDKSISIEDCFTKIVYTIGFQWMPIEDDLQMIFDIISNLDQTNINRLYYKNNLYEFMSNSSMSKALVYLVETLETPYLNPNDVPEEIKSEISVFCDLLMEYVYYPHQVIDGIDRMNNMVKSVCLISDTDSTIISMDAWYRFGLELVKGKKLNILNQTVDLIRAAELDEFGDVLPDDMITFEEPLLDYDFYEDKTIEIQRTIDMTKLIPQDGLRFSLINILAYCLDKIINKHMESFNTLNNSLREGKKCHISMKNEFLFKTALLTNAKKNYAVIHELQEGKIRNNELAIAGLTIDKSTVNKTTRDKMKRVLYEDILTIDNIDQVAVIKKLAILEDEIFNSLATGEKNYYKPLTIKSISSYVDPMKLQGIKASVVWNIVRDDDLEAIDLDIRNAIDIVKVEINSSNADKIKDEYPEVYDRLVEIVGLPKQKPANDQYAKTFKGNITAIAIPKDVVTPIWITQFIDYTTIINDNIKNFPINSIGVNTGKTSINYTNIVSL